MIEINRLTEKYKDYHNVYNRLIEGLRIEANSSIVICRQQIFKFR